MSFLSWVGVKQPFARGEPLAAFDGFVRRERARRRAGGRDFNAERFDRAADLARQALQQQGGGKP